MPGRHSVPVAAWIALLAAIAGAQGLGLTHIVSGRVEDAQGKAIEAAAVELFDGNGILLDSATSDGSGAFELMTLNRGPYTVDVSVQRETASMAVAGDTLLLTVRMPFTLEPKAASVIVSANELEASPKARSRLNQAIAALAKSDYREALTRTKQALDADPHWGYAHYVRSVIELDQKQVAPARADLLLALQEDAGIAPAYVALAQMDVQAHDMAGAEEALQHALNLPPVLWQAYFEMARIDLARGDDQQAADLAARAAADPKAPPECHFIAAQADDKMHHESEAAAEYKLFLASQPAPSPAVTTARQRLDEIAGHAHL